MIKKIAKKVISYTLLLQLIVFMAASPLEVHAAGKGSNDYKAGDNIAFGNMDGVVLNWTVLSFNTTTREALVVATYPYNTKSVTSYKNDIAKHCRGKKMGYVPWSDSFWRYWLNSTFMTSFNEAEKAMIQPTTITVQSHQNSIMNFYHDTSLDQYYLDNDKTKNSLNMAIYNGQKESTDYVFFLSSDEYTSFKDKIPTDRGGVWGLRTSAYDDPVKSLFVNDKTKTISRLYTYDGSISGIRPAMIIKVGDAIEATTPGVEKKKSSTDAATDASKDAAKTEDKTKTADNKAKTADTTDTSKKSTTKTKKKNYANNATDSASTTETKIVLPSDNCYSMKRNGTVKVTLDMNYLNSTDKDYTVTYKSTDSSVFTVDSSGNLAATGTGSANLFVKMKKSNGKVYNMTCRIDVA